MAKKSFEKELANPAMHFISEESIRAAEEGGGQEQQAQQAATPAASALPEGWHLNPMYIENKSKRLHLLVTPTLFGRLKAVSERQGVSLNALANDLIEAGLGKLETAGEGQ